MLIVSFLCTRHCYRHWRDLSELKEKKVPALRKLTFELGQKDNEKVNVYYVIGGSLRWSINKAGKAGREWWGSGDQKHIFGGKMRVSV